MTLGPGFSRRPRPPHRRLHPLPSATSRGGAMQVGSTVTIATGAPGHTLQPGDRVRISGVAEPAYNDARRRMGHHHLVPSPSPSTTRDWRLRRRNVTLHVPGASAAERRSDDQDRASARPRGRRPRHDHDRRRIRGDVPDHSRPDAANVPVPAARRTDHQPERRRLVTYFSPFRIRFGGNTSDLIGGSSQPYNNTTLTTALTPLGSPATVTNAATTGFTLTFTARQDDPLTRTSSSSTSAAAAASPRSRRRTTAARSTRSA